MFRDDVLFSTRPSTHAETGRAETFKEIYGPIATASLALFVGIAQLN